MKKHIFTLLIVSFLLMSCGNSKEETLQEQQQEEIAAQRYMDSVKVANEKAERLRRAFIEEEKQRKLIDANDFIKNFTSELMKLVSPLTGKNPTYQLINSESTFNEDTKTLTVVFESSWDAIPDFNPNSMYESHIYKGRLTVYGTGETRQETISKNDVLKRAIDANNDAVKVLEFLNKNSNNESE